MSEHPSDRLTALVHGEVSAAERRALERHLAGCDACRAELGRLERTHALVEALPPVETPPGLWHDVERGIDDGLARPEPRSRRSRWWLAVAAAALVALAVAVGLRFERGEPSPADATLDLAAFVAALEAEPRQPDGREFGLEPEGFDDVDTAGAAARAAGLADAGEPVMPTPDSQLYGGRVRELAGREVYELIYGNADGPYVLFVLPAPVTPDFGDRSFSRFRDVSTTCLRVASESLAVFWDTGAEHNWVLVGRDHSDAFYAEAMRAVAAAQATAGAAR